MEEDRNGGCVSSDSSDISVRPRSLLHSSSLIWVTGLIVSGVTTQHNKTNAGRRTRLIISACVCCYCENNNGRQSRSVTPKEALKPRPEQRDRWGGCDPSLWRQRCLSHWGYWKVSSWQQRDVTLALTTDRVASEEDGEQDLLQHSWHWNWCSTKQK